MEINPNEVSSEEGVELHHISPAKRRGKVYVKRAKLKLLFKRLLNTLTQTRATKITDERSTVTLDADI